MVFQITGATDTYQSAVLRDSCKENYVCYEQVSDKIFVNCVAVTLHRPAVQTTFIQAASALISSAEIFVHRYSSTVQQKKC